MFKNVIARARMVLNRRATSANITNFFGTKRATNPSSSGTTITVLPNVLQSVSIVLYTCVTESSILTVASPLTQGLVSVFNGQMKYSSKDVFEKYLVPTYQSVCAILKREATAASTGCITLDGWSAALGAPILGVTWHFVDNAWRLRSIPIAMLNTGAASKSGEQLRCIVTEVLKESEIVGSETIRMHTVTSDNEPAVKLACDLLTNYVGSVRCVVHSLALCVNDVFKEGRPWQKYLDHVNKVTTYFNFHSKANVLLKQKQVDSGVTNDRIKRLKHDISTRWHSRLVAMLNYIAEYENICEVAEEQGISQEDVPPLSETERDTLAEVIYVLAEVRRVARQLEADRSVTMSRAPRLFRELYETLCVIAGDMSVSSKCFFDDIDAGSELALDDDEDASTVAKIPSTAEHCSSRDEVRAMSFRKKAARDLARELSMVIKERLSALWTPVGNHVFTWNPSAHETLAVQERAMRRVLLFHIAAIVDVNECELEFLGLSSSERELYISNMYKAVAREALELGGTGSLTLTQLETLFGMLHSEMREELKKCGRREPSHALSYWKTCNNVISFCSPKAFNALAKAALASQASSASAERLFSDLGMLEGRQRQSLLSDTLQMTEKICVYVKTYLKDNIIPQHCLLHPQASSFKRLITKTAMDVVKKA